MSKFFTLSLRAGAAGPFASRLEATEALPQGYGFDSSDIEEYEDDSEIYMMQNESRQDN